MPKTERKKASEYDKKQYFSKRTRNAYVHKT